MAWRIFPPCSPSCFQSFVESCLIADTFLGRKFRSKGGKASIALVFPLAASLVLPSINSLPCMPLCADICYGMALASYIIRT